MVCAHLFGAGRTLIESGYFGAKSKHRDDRILPRLWLTGDAYIITADA